MYPIYSYRSPLSASAPSDFYFGLRRSAPAGCSIAIFFAPESTRTPSVSSRSSPLLGIIGAKLWHVADTPGEHIFAREGFAWFGGLVFGILALLWQGRATEDRRHPDARSGRSGRRRWLRNGTAGLPDLRRRRLWDSDQPSLGHELSQWSGADDATGAPDADL